MQQCMRPACRHAARILDERSHPALAACQTRGRSTSSAINVGLRATRKRRDGGGAIADQGGGRLRRDETSFGQSPNAGPRGRMNGFGGRTEFTRERSSHFGEQRGSQRGFRQREKNQGEWTGRQDRRADRSTSDFPLRSPRQDYSPPSRSNGDGFRSRDDRPTRRDQSAPFSPRSAPTQESNVPLGVPYTTSSSQFVYGFNAVRAALKAGRRKLYKLYTAERDTPRDDHDGSIASLAAQAHVPIVPNAHPNMLDRMSGSRPHNGIVLEASPLLIPPITSLRVEPVANEQHTRVFVPEYDLTHADDLLRAHAPARVALGHNPYRQPLVLLLDGVLDEGNMGNILRTAHFFGVDAVAVAVNTCAPLHSAVVAKASSGACEAVRIFAVPRPAAFVLEAARAGFDVYASVAPPSSTRSEEDEDGKGKGKGKPDRRRVIRTDELAAMSPLQRRPAMVMLGAEGAGLRENLLSKATHLVTIARGGRDWQHSPDVGVDSLNVTVAAGVLLEAFVGGSRRRGGRRPVDTNEPATPETEEVANDGEKLF